MSLYYEDDHVRLYHGDCLKDHLEWLEADVLVTDPPYGRAWKQGEFKWKRKSDKHNGIANDESVLARDGALNLWGDRKAIVFGDLMLAPPSGTKLTGIYAKPVDAGIRGAIAGVRRDAEAIYWIGKWGSGIGGRSSIFATARSLVGSPNGIVAQAGRHPHAKPLDVLEALISLTAGAVADPFAGSGSTLVAAKALGRKAIGVELEEKYCEVAARRLSQEVLDLGGIA